MALISSFILFIKGIRVCKCYKGGIEIERDVNYDIEQQQEYTLRLIKALKTSYTPRKEKKELEDKENANNYITMDDNISEIINNLENEIENNKKNKKTITSYHKKQNSIDRLLNLIKLKNNEKDKSNEPSPECIKIEIDSETLNNQKNNEKKPEKQESKNITQFISKKNKKICY